MSEHYFAAEPGSAQVRTPVRLRAWGLDLTLTSASGVFSHGRVDLGTSVLLRYTEPPADPGVFLDLGCGYGPIACALAVASPGSHVWAVDVNERARRLTATNATALGVNERVSVAAPDAVPDDVVFDAILSNPPVRIGKQALHDLLAAWLPRLRPGGRAFLVVGKNLGADSLQRWLHGAGWQCERRGSAKGFRVLEVSVHD